MIAILRASRPAGRFRPENPAIEQSAEIGCDRSQQHPSPRHGMTRVAMDRGLGREIHHEVARHTREVNGLLQGEAAGTPPPTFDRRALLRGAVGLTRDGRIFTFATNLLDFSGALPTSMQPYTRPDNAVTFNQNYRSNEWAGATFDRRGEWLFANVPTPGVTFAITGPWRSGPL
jgi:hypothetical protein